MRLRRSISQIVGGEKQHKTKQQQPYVDKQTWQNNSLELYLRKGKDRYRDRLSTTLQLI